MTKSKKCKPREVLTFGAFDELHPGHLHLLKRAREYGDRLVVALARDSVIKELKGHAPTQNFKKRKEALLETNLVDQVHRGDHRLGNYRVLSIERPDVIALGHDQDELEADLEKWMKKFSVPLPIVRIEAFKPGKFKSSIIRKKS